LNSELAPERRVADLIPRMTLGEKAGLAFHPPTELPEVGGLTEEQAVSISRSHIQDKQISHFNVLNGASPQDIAAWANGLQEIAGSTRLGIPVTLSSDPRNGYRSTPFTGQSVAALSKWPEAIGMAAIGDPDRAREFGDTARREFLAMGIRVYLGPQADLFTEPRWPRGFGTFGEEPVRASVLARSFISGLRGGPKIDRQSVSAVIKHFPGGGPQKDGNDALDKRFPDQIYPGGQQDLHLRPFEDAIRDGVTQIMAYYGRPVGTTWDEVGFAFNAPVVRDLLRGRLEYDGIAMTDWNVVGSSIIDGKQFGPNSYGLDDVDVDERMRIAFLNGIDQFGGDDIPQVLIRLVHDGLVSEDRLDVSVRRLLMEKFRLGLFDNRFVDLEAAREVGSDPVLAAKGRRAQADAIVLLTEARSEVLPVRAGTRVYAEGIDLRASTRHGFVPVNLPAEAEVIVLQLDSPWEPDPDSPLGDHFRGGSLEFSAAVIGHIADLASHAPVVIFVYLERPAVLTPLLPHVASLLAHFGASDQILLDSLVGLTGFNGTLPFDLPRSMAAVAASREDVPFDTERPLFRHGEGTKVPAAMVSTTVTNGPTAVPSSTEGEPAPGKSSAHERRRA